MFSSLYHIAKAASYISEVAINILTFGKNQQIPLFKGMTISSTFMCKKESLCS